MFKDGMLVQAIRDTKFCKKDEVADVEMYTDVDQDEAGLRFEEDDVLVPCVYFNFEDFVVLEQDTRIAQEFVKCK